MFPFASARSRGRGVDQDHTERYRPGVTGQTRLGNLGPLTRGNHRTKTFAGWHNTQPAVGVQLWRTRHGYGYLVDADGTHPLGRLTTDTFEDLCCTLRSRHAERALDVQRARHRAQNQSPFGSGGIG